MNALLRTNTHFLADDSGVTMIEYGLLAALIAVVCILAIGTVGVNLNATYQAVCQAVSTALGGAGCN
ncbi:MAG TPA: Flp family type IVb pilin [Rhodocyclaceae bacterium]